MDQFYSQDMLGRHGGKETPYFGIDLVLVGEIVWRIIILLLQHSVILLNIILLPCNHANVNGVQVIIFSYIKYQSLRDKNCGGFHNTSMNTNLSVIEYLQQRSPMVGGWGVTELISMWGLQSHRAPTINSLPYNLGPHHLHCPGQTTTSYHTLHCVRTVVNNTTLSYNTKLKNSCLKVNIYLIVLFKSARVSTLNKSFLKLIE